MLKDIHLKEDSDLVLTTGPLQSMDCLCCDSKFLAKSVFSMIGNDFTIFFVQGRSREAANIAPKKLVDTPTKESQFVFFCEIFSS